MVLLQLAVQVGGMPVLPPRSRSRNEGGGGAERAGTIKKSDALDSANAADRQQGDGADSRRDAADAKKKKDGLFKKERGMSLDELMDHLGISDAGGGGDDGDAEEEVFDEEHEKNVNQLFDNPNSESAVKERADLFENELNKLKELQPKLTRRQAAKEATRRAVESLKTTNTGN